MGASSARDGRTYLEVRKAASFRGVVDMQLLRRRIGEADDSGLWVLLGKVERQAAPSCRDMRSRMGPQRFGVRTATEIKDVQPVLQLRLLAVALQHENLSLLKRLLACGVKAAGVLGAGTQAREHELRRHLMQMRLGRSCIEPSVAGVPHSAARSPSL